MPALKSYLKRSARRVGRALQPPSPPAPPSHDAPSQETQTLLRMHYRQLRGSGGPLPSFREVGFKCFSEFEEDGILLFLFSVLGERSRRVVEICAGHGRTCMATNLIINHGWEGFLYDGNEKNVQAARKFFGAHPATRLMPPRFDQAWITAENVNDLLKTAGAEGEIDLLSIDIDGNDYWVWKAIEVVRPRVLLIETNDIIPSDLALTIPYDPAFTFPPEFRDFRGASLAAITKLSRAKGYRLIGAHRHGFNAFFVREDEGTELFGEADIARIHDNPWTRRGQEERWPKVKDLAWVTV